MHGKITGAELQIAGSLNNWPHTATGEHGIRYLKQQPKPNQMKKTLLFAGTCFIATLLLTGCTKEKVKEVVQPQTNLELQDIKSNNGSAALDINCPVDLTIHILADPNMIAYYFMIYDVVGPDTIPIYHDYKVPGQVLTADVTDDLKPGCGAFPLLLNHKYLFGIASGTDLEAYPCRGFQEQYAEVIFTKPDHGQVILDLDLCRSSFAISKPGHNVSIHIGVDDWGGGTLRGSTLY